MADSPQRQVAERWTGRLAAAGWTPVSDFFLANYHRVGITHTEAMVIVHLVSFKWDRNAPFPSLKTIAKRMGITPPSVRTHLRSLENKRILLREMQIGQTNKFHLDGLFKILEDLMAKDEEAAAIEEQRQRRPFSQR